MTLFDAVLIAGGTLLAATTALWMLSVVLKDSSIIDIFWGPFFVLVGWVLFACAGADVRTNNEALLVLLLVTLWGLRLGFHLYVRNAGAGEDTRYQRWRAKAGPNWWLISFYRVYLLQAGIALIVALPIIAALTHPEDEVFSTFNLLGVALWMCGFYFELNGDLQLTRFRSAGGKGPLMEGLWKYTRHPNYFGDAAQWWGIALIALSWSNWYVLLGPAAMTAVLLNISSGMLERGMKHTRPGYAAYQERTPAFIPWFPKRHS